VKGKWKNISKDGLQRGKREGMQQGMQRGRRQSMSTVAKTLNDRGYAHDEAVSFLMQAFNLERTEAENYWNGLSFR